ncbi:hypothetical protein GJAV_G00243920 [Gymnothorax javanicus]|nr:hypothetical protein GJAV_G00243920 [Gymnothorax javanicus]
MDIYDPQTLGIVVFGGFMVISAIGIALVSTFSMKETSYEEALAKQRKALGQTPAPPPSKEKKRREKSRSKKREDKPNGKLPEVQPEPEPAAIAVETVSDSEPEPVPELPIAAATAVLAAEAPPAPSPAKKRKEKKVAKVEPAPAPAPSPAPTSAPAPASTPAPAPAPAKPALVLEAVTKEVPVMAVPPVGAPAPAPVLPAPAPAKEEPKTETPSKKKAASKKKAEPVAVVVDGVDAPLYLPFKTLVSTVSSMAFSEGEAQRLIEILADKAGIVQDTWHTATQKGDPLTALRKQLEEKERQLSSEQDDAAAAKNRLRELSKELNAEKSKLAQVEARLGAQLTAREQEVAALEARMQASYQDHISETQQLNAKVLSLQDQLEKGPNAQLARLQQENSILRDALNQATSQTESKQNAELAKLRQECARLGLELGEKSEALQAHEQLKTGLESRASAAEIHLTQIQAERAESERALQARLEDVSEELRAAQANSHSLQLELENARLETSSVVELQARVASAEAELKEQASRAEGLQAELGQAEVEKTQLQEQIATITALLEADRSRDMEDDVEITESAQNVELQKQLEKKESELKAVETELMQLKETLQPVEKGDSSQEVALLQNSLQEAQLRVTSLEEELRQVKGDLEKLKDGEEPSGDRTEIEQLQSSLKEKQNRVMSLEEELQQLREMEVPDHSGHLEALQKRLEEKESRLSSMEEELKQLKGRTEHVQSESHADWLQDFTQKAQESLGQTQQRQETPQPAAETADSVELLEKLREAEESQNTLQAECEQYRTVLAETEGMLKDLQKSVEEEELVWRAKIAQSEEQLQRALARVRVLESAAEQMTLENQSAEQLKEQVMLLEAQLEKQLEATTPTDSSSFHGEETEVESQVEQTTVEQERAESLSGEQEPDHMMSGGIAQPELNVTELREQQGEAASPHTATVTEQVELTKDEEHTPLDHLQGKEESEELTEGTSV